MKTIIIGAISLLALSGCAATAYQPETQCSNYVWHSPDAPRYAIIGALIGTTAGLMLGNNDTETTLFGAGVGAAAGVAASGGLYTGEVCPSMSKRLESFS